MTDEQHLIEKLQRIVVLFAGAAMPGERDAAAQASDRIRCRLREQQQTDPPVDFAFKLRDRWSHKLLIATSGPIRNLSVPFGALDSPPSIPSTLAHSARPGTAPEPPRRLTGGSPSPHRR